MHTPISSDGPFADPGSSGLHVSSLLRLIHMACPSLPIGAYAYSQGLEPAVECGKVADEASAREWIIGLLKHSLVALDLPILYRCYAAWERRDPSAVRQWSRLLLACRESAELQAEEQHLGRALARVLAELGTEAAGAWVDDPDTTYVAQFALAGCSARAPQADIAAAYCFAWLEHQVSAAIRLVPLGQLSGQRVLARGIEEIPAVVFAARSARDDAIGFVAPAVSLLSARHETQYSRLFRS